MLLYISIALNVVFFAIVIGAVVLLQRAGKAINSYESFYQQTLSDLEKHLSYMQQLMKSNVMLAEDEDVKKVFKSIKSYYQLMLGYVNAGNGGPATTPRRAEKEEKLLR